MYIITAQLYTTKQVRQLKTGKIYSNFQFVYYPMMHSEKTLIHNMLLLLDLIYK